MTHATKEVLLEVELDIGVVLDGTKNLMIVSVIRA